jgi:long-chain acyl-CoA synthetase
MANDSEKFWLASYPPGIPREVDVDAFTSLNEVLSQSCKRFAALPAFSNLGATLTYADLNRLSGAFAAFLQKGLGLNKGARVAIMLPNVLQYPIALFGALRAGLTVVNVNPLYTARELEYQLRDSGAQTIIVLENFARTLQQALPRTAVKAVITTELGDMLSVVKRLLVNLVVKRVKKLVPDWRISGAIDFRACLERGSGMNLDEIRIEQGDIAFLQYTGGTTGVPKGAMLTHRNMVANLQQATAWMSCDLKEGEETVVTPLPLYHIFSLTANCLTFMKYGGHNVLITNPRDLPGFVGELKKLQFSAITGVNTLYNALLNTSGFADLDFARLKIALGGGAAVQRAVAERWKAITGRPLIEAYGLTECAPAACINPLSIDAYTGSVGLPIPSTEVSIRDAEGKAVPFGTVGEICVRGPQVMKGYWNLPEATAEVLTEDGWLRTGDLGTMDERGYVRITDRKKDMILVSGFNVYPTEIEDVAAMYAGVLESAAIGIADPKSGEAVKLFVVRRDPNLRAEDLMRHLRENLTGYKVPKVIEFRSELPKSTIGKILRRALHDATPLTGA